MKQAFIARRLLVLGFVGFGEEGDVEGEFGLGLGFGGLAGFWGFVADGGALGVDADPVAVEALEDVGEDAAFLDDDVVDAVGPDVGAVGNGDVAEGADGDDFLLEGGADVALVGGVDEVGDLLVAGGDFAGGGDVDEEGGEDELEGVLVVIGDG